VELNFKGRRIVEFKTKIFVMAFSLFGLLSFATPTHSELIQTSERTSQEILSALATEQHSLALVSLSPLVVNGKTLGEVLVYDDPTTKRPVDYLALHDSAGDLVALGWFDQFGIQRIAVDRGLLDEGDELEGVFVFFLDGDSI
jgi:hypothetical protein